MKPLMTHGLMLIGFLGISPTFSSADQTYPECEKVIQQFMPPELGTYVRPAMPKKLTSKSSEDFKAVDPSLEKLTLDISPNHELWAKWKDAYTDFVPTRETQKIVREKGITFDSSILFETPNYSKASPASRMRVYLAKGRPVAAALETAFAPEHSGGEKKTFGWRLGFVSRLITLNDRCELRSVEKDSVVPLYGKLSQSVCDQIRSGQPAKKNPQKEYDNRWRGLCDRFTAKDPEPRTGGQPTVEAIQALPADEQ